MLALELGHGLLRAHAGVAVPVLVQTRPEELEALEGAVPDGICLDAEGCIWVASPVSKEVLRVREGGEVVERLATGDMAIACMLGGPRRRTLYVLVSETTHPDEAVAKRSARILATEVEVAGAGLP